MKMQKLKLYSILACLMILNGCSTNPSRSTEPQTIFISIPAMLMQHFCEFQGPGETVGELSEGYVNNTLCGKKYQAQVDEQIEYIKNVQKEKGTD